MGVVSIDKSAPEPGLRERNRVRRSGRMERAALSLALEHGVDNVTVEMICELSDVSPRTFFNYFGSKEGALLGQMPSPPSPEVIEDFLGGSGSVFEDFVLALVRTFLADPRDEEIVAMRRRLFDREPELQALQYAHWAQKRQAMIDRVFQRLALQDPDLPEREARDEARLVASIALSTYPILTRMWLDSGCDCSDPGPYVEAALAGVRRVVG